MLLSVYSPNFRMNYGVMVIGFSLELWHDLHRSYGMIIIELW